jgi:hypothetical protein
MGIIKKIKVKLLKEVKFSCGGKTKRVRERERERGISFVIDMRRVSHDDDDEVLLFIHFLAYVSVYKACYC